MFSKKIEFLIFFYLNWVFSHRILNHFNFMSTIKEKTVSQIWQNAKKHYDASLVGLPGDMENYELC